MGESGPTGLIEHHFLQVKDTLWIISTFTAFFSKTNNFFWSEKVIRGAASYKSLANPPLLALARCTLAFTISLLLNTIFPKPTTLLARSNKKVEGRYLLIEGISTAISFWIPLNLLRNIFIVIASGFLLIMIGLLLSFAYTYFSKTPQSDSKMNIYSPRKRTRSGHVFSLVPLIDDMPRDVKKRTRSSPKVQEFLQKSKGL